MGVKLQLVLGLVLLSSAWISSSTSVEINSPKPQEHQNDDKNTNVIHKQPKTETEIKYVNNNTPTNSQTNSETKSENFASQKIDDQNEKQNEVEKDTNTENNNTIKKDAAPKRREGSSRSIDIEKYISPEFQNNEFTLPVSSDTEKYLDEPFSFKTSTKTGPEFEHTTQKTSMFIKFTEPVQKLEQEFEDHLKSTEDEHHLEFGHHMNSGYDHEEEHDQGSEDIERNSENGRESEDPFIDDFTVDKMRERDESVPRNISLGWEMKISKDDPDKNNSKNLKSFTVVKYRKVDYVTHFNDTKVFLNEPKGDTETINNTTSKPVTSTTRKNNLLTKPPVDKNNSHILSNKIESETIKAINLITTETPSTKKSKGDEEALPKEQITQENQLPESVVAANEQTTPTEVVTSENTTIEKNTVEVDEAYLTTTSKSASTGRTTSKYTSKSPRVIINTGPSRTINETTTVSINTSESTLQPVTETTSVPETTTPQKPLYPSTTEFSTEEIFLGTDVTTNTDVEITTEFETKVTPVQHFKTRSMSSQVSNSEITESTTVMSTVSDLLTSTENQKTEPYVTTESITEMSTINTKLLNKVTAEITTETETEKTVTTTTSLLEETTKIAETTENTEFTGSVGEIMSDATSTIPESSTEKEITTPKTYTIKTTTENKIVTPAVTEKLTEISTVANTTEVNFVHVETVGNNQTTFVPETLSPNFNYPITNIDTKERAAPKANGSTAPVETTTEENEESTRLSSSTENIVNDGGGSNKGKIAAIAISTVGAICLVVLAGLLYIMKKRQRKFNYKQRCRPVSLDDYSVDNMSAYNSVRRKGVDRQSKRSYGNPAFEDPTVPSHPLNFPALAKFATNIEDMKAEFEEIPQISARASELPEGCDVKNRYANVIPLPETRVYLKTIEGVPNSDYINANYVTGPKNTRGYYIACQAPKQNTVDDFWRMIWEQQCRVILMITHLFENGVEKCADYLPPSEVLDCHRLFGDFQVTLKKREAKEKYIISSIQLKNMVSNSWRDVTHFWYLGWPEKGIPPEANSLIAFLIEARSYMNAATLDKTISPQDMRSDPSQNELNPVVVHCSPGTGRTGVVIASDIAIREFEKIRLVDIPKIVYKIRRDRANAVQTKEQYMFIYKVISLYATKLTGGALDTF